MIHNDVYTVIQYAYRHPLAYRVVHCLLALPLSLSLSLSLLSSPLFFFLSVLLCLHEQGHGN